MHSILSAGVGDQEQSSSSLVRSAFSIREVSEQLGICQASVYRALKRGELQAVTLGGRRLIPARSLEKLLSAKAA